MLGFVKFYINRMNIKQTKAFATLFIKHLILFPLDVVDY